MFNALWLNGGALNDPAVLGEVVSLGTSAVSVSVQADAADLWRIKGLSANAPLTVAQVSSLERQRTMTSAVAAWVHGYGDLGPTRTLGGAVAASVTGFLGWGAEKLLYAEADVTVTGILFPYDVLFDATGTATAAADPAVLDSITSLAGTASVSVSEVTEELTMYRGSTSSVECTVEAAATFDVTIGGVRHALLGTSVALGVTADPANDCVVDTRMASSVLLSVLATPVAPGGLQRRRRMMPGLHSVQAIAAGTMRPVRNMSAVAASATAQAASATIFRNTRFAPDPRTATVVAAPARPKVAMRLAGNTSASATANQAAAELERIAGLRATALAQAVSATANLSDNKHAKMESWSLAHVEQSDPGPALSDNKHAKLYGQLRTAANVTASPSPTLTHWTLHSFAANVMVDVQGQATLYRSVFLASEAPRVVVVEAEGDLFTNLFDDEPDYRTVFVGPQDDELLLVPQDTTLNVTQDKVPMKTFTKQPGDRLPYDLNFTEWFADLQGDEIETVSAVVTEASDGATAGLTIMSALVVGSPAYIAKIWIDDGVNGTTYKITASIVTEGGRHKEVDFRMRIKEI